MFLLQVDLEMTKATLDHGRPANSCYMEEKDADWMLLDSEFQVT